MTSSSTTVRRNKLPTTPATIHDQVGDASSVRVVALVDSGNIDSTTVVFAIIIYNMGISLFQVDHSLPSTIEIVTYKFFANSFQNSKLSL